MLVIRRRAGESILIADEIEIEVLETTPTRVKLGIKAPKEVAVLRKEVRLTEDHNRAAAEEIPLDLLTPLLSLLRAKP
jgi:carbon storage regulator